MIKFKVKIALKDYFYASYLILKHKGLKRIFLVSLLGSFITLITMPIDNVKCFVTSTKDCIASFLILFFLQLVFFMILVFIFAMCLSFVFIPLLKFCIVRFYYKQKFMEYYFDKGEIGWEIGGNKLSYKKELIEHIKIFPRYFLIQLKMKKIILFFLAEEKVIKDVTVKLKKTNYKKYLVL